MLNWPFGSLKWNSLIFLRWTPQKKKRLQNVMTVLFFAYLCHQNLLPTKKNATPVFMAKSPSTKISIWLYHSGSQYFLLAEIRFSDSHVDDLMKITKGEKESVNDVVIMSWFLPHPSSLLETTYLYRTCCSVNQIIPAMSSAILAGTATRLPCFGHHASKSG